MRRTPAHQARAIQMSPPTGCCSNKALIVLTIEVTGWFSAKARTGPGIEAVGTKAELMKGSKMSGYEKAAAPSVDFADSPAITAIQVSASVTRARMPATASHASTPADERKPMRSATPTMTTTEIALETSEVRTCPHSTDERAIGIDWNLSKMPLCRSLNRRRAV